MSEPTTGVYFNSTDPAAPANNQNVVPQTDGATPLQSITFAPQAATPDLLGVVKPDNITTSVAADGTLSANTGKGSLTNPMTGEIDIDCPNPTTRGLVIRGAAAPGASQIVQSAYTTTGGTDEPKSATFGSRNVAGNSIIFVGFKYNGFASNSVADSAGNSYINVFGDGANYIIFLAKDIAAFTGNEVTFTAPGGFIEQFAILEVSGLTGYDTAVSASGSPAANTPLSTGNITTTGADDLVLVCGAGATGATLSELNGYPLTLNYDSGGADDPGQISIWSSITGPGTLSDSVQQSASGSLTCAILAFVITTPASDQIADLQDWTDYQGNVLSGINAMGQLVLAATAGLPTNTPNGPALAFDLGTGQVVIYIGGEWVPLSGGGGGGGGSPDYTWIEEFPNGTIDGENAVFATTYTPVIGMPFRAYRNGVRLNRLAASPVNAPLDFILSDGTITFTVPPAAGSQPDVMIVEYWTASSSPL
jgi:hypothetical protein